MIIRLFVAHNLRSWLRSRSYVGAIVAVTVLIITAGLLNELSGAEAYRTLIDIGLLFVGVATVLLTTTHIIQTFSSRDDRYDLLVVAARPIERSTIMVSYLVGYAVLALTTCILLGLILTLAAMAIGAPFPMRVLLGSLAGSLEAIAMIGVTAALACDSSRSLAAGMTFGSYIVLRVGASMAEIAGSSLPPIFKYLPRLDGLCAASWAHGGVFPSEWFMRVLLALALAWTGATVAILRFKRADLAKR